MSKKWDAPGGDSRRTWNGFGRWPFSRRWRSYIEDSGALSTPRFFESDYAPFDSSDLGEAFRCEEESAGEPPLPVYEEEIPASAIDDIFNGLVEEEKLK